MSVDMKSEAAGTGGLGEVVKVIVHALILAMVVRVFLFQPFNIPSGSMKDTLLIGDYLFVSKYSYGYSKFSFPFGFGAFDGRIWEGKPERGDVAVFRNPRRIEDDFIKRVIGLPGDTVQMRGGILHINGEPVSKQPDGAFETREHGRLVSVPRFIETLPNGVKYHVLDAEQDGDYDNTPIYTVPAGHYFMMGDNRDNSTDSREQRAFGVGFVPLENFIGRAEIIFFSGSKPWALLKPWEWGSGVRWSRFFNLVR